MKKLLKNIAFISLASITFSSCLEETFPTVQVGNMLFASGQLGLDPATGNFVEGGVKEQTVQAFKNVHAILEEAGLSIDDVVKTTVFLADMSDFVAMNEVYASQFEGTFPARSAVAVKTLPKNGLVEIEVIAVKE